MVKIFDDILWGLMKGLGGNPSEWIMPYGHYLEAPHILITADGGCLTVLEGKGLRSLPYDVMGDLVEDFSSKLSGPLSNGHVITIDYERDPQSGLRIVRENMEFARRAIADYRLDLGGLLDEREKVLSRFVSYERTWICLWTPPPFEKRLRKEYLSTLKKKKKTLPQGIDSFIDMSQFVVKKHQAFVDTITTDLDKKTYVATVLKAHDAIAAMRNYLFPSLTHPLWKPKLLGDRFRPGMTKHLGVSAENIARPSIGEQVVPQDITYKNGFVVMGGRHYKVFGMKVAPGRTESFAKLVSSLRIPFKMHIRMGGGGYEKIKGIKLSLARILSFDPISANNRQIVSAIDALKFFTESHGFVVDLRMSFATWGHDEDSASSNASELYQRISTWGTGSTPDISEHLARPSKALVQMAPGASSTTNTWIIPAPIEEALWMTPLSRSASPWDQGPFEFRTDDGKFFPVDPVSSKQTAHFSIGFAPMRMGKSLMSNGRILSLFLRPGSRLPRVLIIDIGWSSSGLVDLLRNAVEPSERGKFQHYRVQMDKKKFGYNPFDLPVGFRTPLPAHRGFLNNLLMTLCTPLGEKAPPEPVPGFLAKIIDSAYEKFAPNRQPRAYNKGVDPAIEEAVQTTFKDMPKTWWEVMDGLFKAGKIDLATKASRYAVPTLNEIAGLAKDADVGTLYAKSIVATTNEPVTDYVFRSVAETIRDYPILSVPTCFETGDARLMAFDLGDVTQTSPNPKDHKQAAVMYMLARQMGGRDFYLHHDAIHGMSESDLPKFYREYHETRAKEIQEDRKDIVFDEFHRTGGHGGIRAQVLLDVREGPKHNVSISLFSQMVEDFDEAMRGLAQRFYILGAGQGNEVDKVVELFKFSPNVEEILRKHMYKPDKGGSHVFVRHITEKGTYEAKLRYTRGPMELWAFSTTPIDNMLRNRLYDMIGADNARRKLAERFPGGSAEDEINRRVSFAIMKGGGESEQVMKTVVDGLIKEILDIKENHDKR